MSDKRYTDEFKQEAIKQITERGHSVADASGYSSVFKVDLVDAEDCSQSLLLHITQHGIEL